MKIFQQIWDDIKGGKNIANYAVIIVAFTLAVLKFFEFSSSKYIISLAYTVIFLLAIAILSNSSKLDNLINKVDLLSQKHKLDFRTYEYQLEESLKRIDLLFQAYILDFKIYEKWTDSEIHNLLKSAKKSIIIIDSWFDDASILSALRNCEINSDSKLLLEVYMADPDQLHPHGFYRYLQIYGHKSSPNSDREKFADYKAKFNNCLRNLSAHVDKLPYINLEVRKYSIQPVIRLFMIDQKEFLFTWFPPHRPSAGNAYFHITKKDSNSDLTKENQGKVIKNLKEYYQYLKNNSEKIDLLQ